MSVRRNDVCIVYLHGNTWDGVPARQRYLMEQMARFAPVVYLENSDRRKWRVDYQQPATDVTVVGGLMPMWLRFQRRGWLWAQRLTAWWYLRPYRRRYRRVILWEALNWLEAYRFVPHDVHVYDCIDPCFSDDPAQLAAFNDREQRISAHADVVFASAEVLAEGCRRLNDRVVLLNNGCAPDEYHPELLAAAARPSWWPMTDRPVAAYLGTLDARFDVEVVERACRDNPDVQFMLAGAILPELQADVRRVTALGNVTCPGRISVEDGRYLLSRCAVGLIPFIPGPMSDAINPVKLYAYALLGKPIVGTAIRELTGRPEVATTAATPADFAKRVTEAIAESGNESARKAWAAGNTWAERAKQAWSALRSVPTTGNSTRM